MKVQTVLDRKKIVQFSAGFVVACLVLASGLLVSNFAQVKQPIGENSSATKTATDLPHNQQSRLVITDGLLDFEQIEGIADANMFERALALDGMLRHANAELVNRLFVHSSQIRPSSERTALQEELLLRLATFDPVQALDLLKNKPRREQRILAAPVFQEWASVDLDSAIEYTNTLQPFFLREIAFGAMLEVKEDLSQREKEQIGRQLQQSDFAIQEAIGKSEMASRKSNEDVWTETLSSTRPFNLKYSALVDLAQDWIDHEGLIAISKINETTTDWRIRRGVLRECIRWSARSDPKSTFEFAMSSFLDTDFDLVITALKHWVEREPKNALAALDQMENNRQQKELYRNAISQWAIYAPREALHNLEQLPEEMQVHAQREAYSNIRDLLPQEVTQLAARHLGGFWHFDAPVLLRNWKSYAFEEALDWALTNATHKRTRDDWADSLFNGIKPSTAELALQRIVKEPLSEKDVGFEAYIIVHLAERDVGAALNFLPRLRNDKTRREAIRHAARSMAIRSKFAIAWRFGSGLTESERKEFYDDVLPSWLSDLQYSPSSVLSQIEKLPSSELRSLAALQTIQIRKATKNISQSDETKLKVYLLDEELERLNQTEFVITY